MTTQIGSTSIDDLPSFNQQDNIVDDVLNQITDTPSSLPNEVQYMRRQEEQPPSIKQKIVYASQQPPNMLEQYYPDLKLCGFVFLSVIVVHFLNADEHIKKIINLTNVPYWDIILRAIVISLGFIIFKKLIS